MRSRSMRAPIAPAPPGASYARSPVVRGNKNSNSDRFAWLEEVELDGFAARVLPLAWRWAGLTRGRLVVIPILAVLVPLVLALELVVAVPILGRLLVVLV